MKLVLLAAALATVAAGVPAQGATKPAATQSQPSRFGVEIIGNGPDVILIPGLSSTRDVFAATANRLKDRYRVHLVQVRGFGEPAGPNVRGPVLDPLVDELAGYAGRLRKPAIVGHSMGGLAAMMIAVRQPDVPGRVLVVDALPFIGTLFGADSVAAIKPQAEQMRAAMAGGDIALPVYDRPDCKPGPPPDKTVGVMTNSVEGACLMTAGARASDRRVVAQAMYDDMTTDLRPQLGAIRVPVTVLYPQDDRLLDQATAERIYGTAFMGAKTARLVRVPGSFHFIMQDQPAAFARELEAFLR